MVLFVCLLSAMTTVFADSFVLNNQVTKYINNKQSKMAILWANSGKSVEEINKAIIEGEKLNPKSLRMINRAGNISLNIPKNAEYFRVLVWSQGENEPSLLTNWIEIVPNKTYTLNEDYLMPKALMSGMGC